MDQAAGNGDPPDPANPGETHALQGTTKLSLKITKLLILVKVINNQMQLRVFEACHGRCLPSERSVPVQAVCQHRNTACLAGQNVGQAAKPCV